MKMFGSLSGRKAVTYENKHIGNLGHPVGPLLFSLQIVFKVPYLGSLCYSEGKMF